jgi:hypothetical protein
VVAYFGKGYADLHRAGGGYDTERLPRHGAVGARSSAAVIEARASMCPTCFTQLPAMGKCDDCDA